MRRAGRRGVKGGGGGGGWRGGEGVGGGGGGAGPGKRHYLFKQHERISVTAMLLLITRRLPFLVASDDKQASHDRQPRDAPRLEPRRRCNAARLHGQVPCIPAQGSKKAARLEILIEFGCRASCSDAKKLRKPAETDTNCVPR